MSKNTRIYDRFQYFAEDCDCSVCLYWKGAKRGCTLTACCCEDIRSAAVKGGRVSRKPKTKRK